MPDMEPFLHSRRTKRDVPAESLSCTTMPLCGLPFGSFRFSACISSEYAAISNGLNQGTKRGLKLEAEIQTLGAK